MLTDIVLEPGLEYVLEETVELPMTVASVDPRMPQVYGTPYMIRSMEIAAHAAVAPLLPAGFITVGTAIHVEHLAATPLGMKVRVRALLTKANGRFLEFAVEARDHRELVGRGTVGRAIIDQVKFERKMAAKAAAG